MSNFFSSISEMGTIKYLSYLIAIALLYLAILVTFESFFSSSNNGTDNIKTENIEQVISDASINDSLISNTDKSSNEVIDEKDKIKSNKKNSFDAVFFNDDENEKFEKEERLKKENEAKRKLAQKKKNKKSEFSTPDFMKKNSKKSSNKKSSAKKKPAIKKYKNPYNRNKNETYNIIQSKNESVKKCIKRSRVKFKGLTGVVDYQISISKDGKVIETVILSSKWNSKKYGNKTEQCIIKTMKYWKFPIVRNKEPYKIKSKFVF